MRHTIADRYEQIVDDLYHEYLAEGYSPEEASDKAREEAPYVYEWTWENPAGVRY
jgi:hypothetical protein